MKKVALSLLFSLVTLSTYAQHQPGPPPPPGAPPGLDAQGPQGGVLADYLQLTADQKTAFAAAGKEFQTSLTTLDQNLQTARAAFDAALASTTPDATTVGNAALAVKAAHDAIKAAHDALDTKLEALLTADQKTKYEAFQAAAAFLQTHGPGPRP